MENNTLISDLFLLFLMVGGIVLIYKLVTNHYDKKTQEEKKQLEKWTKEAEKSHIARGKTLETIEKIIKEAETSTIKRGTNTTVTKSKKSTVLPYPTNYNGINRHPIDNNLKYDPNKEEYIFEGGLISNRVSLLIESFFQEFNSGYWAEKKAIERGLEDPQQVLDEWDCKGAIARELGQFLHEQIGNYLQKKALRYVYEFSYNSEYISVIEKYDIKKELSYLRSFIKENKIIPYRTEWSIVDTRYMIAGTIDLLCKDGNDSFILYDWKRSKKIGWELPHDFYIDSNNWGKYGFGELGSIGDHRFNKYCLQQNLYKYILESNYGMKISKMYLVVLHPDYSKYHLLEVPDMQKEVLYMLEKKESVLINK